jgi:hypothetical protein
MESASTDEREDRRLELVRALALLETDLSAAGFPVADVGGDE